MGKKSFLQLTASRSQLRTGRPQSPEVGAGWAWRVWQQEGESLGQTGSEMSQPLRRPLCAHSPRPRPTSQRPSVSHGSLRT